MENYLDIGKVNIRYHMLWHITAAVLFLCAAPLLMGISNLDAGQTAQVLEMYVCLAGIILFIPVFLPENDKNIRELTASKYICETKVWAVRLAESMILLMLLYLAFVLNLKAHGSVFSLGTAYGGVLANAVFLGGIGILGYGLTDHVIIGYMIPMMYYIGNFGGSKYFGKFYLFSMMQGSAEEKIWLAAAGVICILLGVWVRRVRN